MKRIFFLFALSFSLLNAAGTYDGYAFSDEEELYSLHFVNTSLSTEMTGIGLSAADSTAILGLRPITALSGVASNANITGRDMVLIRSRSYAVEIPDHNTSMTEYNALGIKVFDFNFLMALTGLFVGFVFLFFLVYTTIDISRGSRG